MTGKVVVVVAGVVIVVLAGIGFLLSDEDPEPSIAGDRPVPFQDDDDQQSRRSEEPTTATESQPPDSVPTASGEGSAGRQTTLPQEPLEIELHNFDLVVAYATVHGLGDGAAYVWGAPGFDYAAYGAFLLSQDAYLDQIQSVDQVSCTLPSTVLVIDKSGIRLAPNPAFAARFAVSQTEFVSIGDNGEGVVTGGFSRGDGTREGSEQWPIFRDGSLDMNADIVHDIEDDPYADPTFWDPRFDGVFVTATWSGESEDDMSEESAEGTVKVVCVFAELDG